jgi:hypothetical protein
MHALEGEPPHMQNANAERAPVRVTKVAEVIQLVQAKLKRKYPLLVRLSNEVLQDVRLNSVLSKNIVNLIMEHFGRHPNCALRGTPRHNVQYLSDQFNSEKQQLVQNIFEYEVYYSLCLRTYAVEINLIVPVTPNNPGGSPATVENAVVVARPFGVRRLRRFLLLLAFLVASIPMVHQTTLDGSLENIGTAGDVVVGLAERIFSHSLAAYHPRTAESEREETRVEKRRVYIATDEAKRLSKPPSPVQMFKEPTVTRSALVSAQSIRQDDHAESSRAVSRQETTHEHASLPLETMPGFQGHQSTANRHLDVWLMQFIIERWFTNIYVPTANEEAAQRRRPVPLVKIEKRATSFRSASSIP